MTTADIATATRTDFLNGSEIRYPCWGYEGGYVHAKYDADFDCWLVKYSGASDFVRVLDTSRWSAFPTDAELVGAA